MAPSWGRLGLPWGPKLADILWRIWETKCLVFARLSFTWQYKALRVDDASHWTKCDLMPDRLGQRGM